MQNTFPIALLYPKQGHVMQHNTNLKIISVLKTPTGYSNTSFCLATVPARSTSALCFIIFFCQPVQPFLFKCIYREGHRDTSHPSATK
jgi:hypothetical protein